MSNSKLPRRPSSEKNPYHLNEFREKEIIYFCLQYNDWKKRLNVINLRHSSNPTEEEACIRNACLENMRIVENACKRAYEAEWELLLKGVTDQGSNWYNFKLLKGMQCGRDRYYELKHEVYYYVSQKDRINFA